MASFLNIRQIVDFAVLPLMNVAVALLISGLVVLFVGQNPLEAVGYLVSGALGSGEGIGFTLYFATSFMFTGLAVAVASHAGLFTIGAEGQAYLGGLGIALVCLSLDRIVPWYVTLVPAAAAGMLLGAAWAFIPAYLQAKRGSHLVITTIMFNFIASSIMIYMLVNVIKERGSMAPQTRLFDSGGLVPKLGEILPVNIGTAPLNVSLFIAIAAAVFVWVLIWKTKLGFEIRATGANPAAARNAGISYVKITIVCMLISGALAGLAGVNILMGDLGKLQLDFPAGIGLVGVAVALMGRGHPVGIAIASVLFGVLYQGGAEISFWMPNITRELIMLIQGLVILFAGALSLMFRSSVFSLADLFRFSKPEA